MRRTHICIGNKPAWADGKRSMCGVNWPVYKHNRAEILVVVSNPGNWLKYKEH